MTRVMTIILLAMVLAILAGCGPQTFTVPLYPNAENIQSTPFARKDEGGMLYQTITFTTGDSPHDVQAWYHATLIDQGWSSTAEVMGLPRADVRFGNTPMDQGIATHAIGLRFEERSGKTSVTIDAISR